MAAAMASPSVGISRRSAMANGARLVATVGLGVALLVALILAEASRGDMPVQWPMFVTVAILVVICERWPATWISLGQDAEITMLPTFAYALLLVGSPVKALAVALIGSLVHTATKQDAWWARLFHLARILISVASAGLVLMAMGVRGSVVAPENLPWRWSLGIVLAGITILVLDTVVIEIARAVRRNVSFVGPLRRTLLLRATAVGALLSLSPIWVIGLKEQFVLAPLLAITTVLVFVSTGRAHQRAHEADHDPLTGLANRRSFNDQLIDTCMAPGNATTGALLVMDLDGFKNVNDRLGHDAGDDVLVAFAERLRARVPENAVTSRLGGDEFAVFLTWRRGTGDIDTVVADLHARLAEPLTVQGFPLSVGVSIGVARYPIDGRTAEELFHAADIAMYRSKRLGTDVELYHSVTDSIQTGRLGLLSDLGTAVLNDEMRVNFQPQLCMRTGDIVAVEALVRWQHPEYGTIAPNDFIGLAEQTDLIGPITESVLRLATNGLLMTGYEDVRLAVNSSVRNLQDPNFSASTLAILRTTGFAPERLELEVTERALITDADRSRSTIAELRAAGVRITVDGFGTGYASYQTLRDLQVDRVKIDRDFILRILHDDADLAIVESVISLAHTLGLEVIAEGIESGETWDVLERLGCDAAQGFGIAMPMSVTSLWSWFREYDRERATTG